jgi:hypothetical protein
MAVISPDDAAARNKSTKSQDGATQPDGAARSWISLPLRLHAKDLRGRLYPVSAGTFSKECGLPDLVCSEACQTGCSPVYWKQPSTSGTGTGYTQDQTLESVVCCSRSLGLDSSTLLEALNFAGGSDDLGAATSLFRAAVAALLNAASPGVDYPTLNGQSHCGRQCLVEQRNTEPTCCPRGDPGRGQQPQLPI